MKGRLRIDFESLLPLITLVILGLFINQIHSAPAVDDEDADGGCYYMFNHYGEGDRILTNEPCLNCTCHNSMLMCYLRVCPFTKPIGQDCTIEKKPDQCCPSITCPEEDVRIHTDQKNKLVPVSLVTPNAPSSTTQSTTSLAPVDSTELAPYERGCEMNGKYYADGAQVEGDPAKPCELCYCIRNQTACVMQECILHVEGCEPVFQAGVCCPTRYRCDYPPQITDESSTLASVITTTISSIFQTTPQPGGCYRGGEYYADGSQIPGAEPSPCEHCYCMRGEIVCAVQECGTPLEDVGNCTAVPPPPGHCCPEKYTCGDDEEISADEAASTPTSIVEDSTIVADSVSSSPDVSTSSPAEAETEPTRDATTVEPMASSSPQTGEPAQGDQAEDQDSVPELVPPTTLSPASDKIGSESSTQSPSSDGESVPIDQEDEDVVQTPTEASVPPMIVPADATPSDRPEIPTEPSVVPGATELPPQADDSSSGTTEQSQEPSSPEPVDEIIIGTTNQPEPIPSENLQKPSERPESSQEESGIQTGKPDIVSITTGAPTETTVKTTAAPETPEILDIGSSEEEGGRPSEPSVTASTISPSDSQRQTTQGSASDLVPPSTIPPPVEEATEEVPQQQDDDLPVATQAPASVTSAPAPTGSPAIAEDGSASTHPPSQSDAQTSQDESEQSPTEGPQGADSVPVTTEGSTGEGEETASVASQDELPGSAESGVQTTASPPISDDDDVQASQDSTSGPDSAPVSGTTQSPHEPIGSTDQPTSSSPVVQQDEGVTTSRPESPVTGIAPSDVAADGSQADDTTGASTVRPELPEEIQTSTPQDAEGADQPTTDAVAKPVEAADDAQSVSDQVDDTVPATSEQPESSTSSQLVSQPDSPDQQDEPAGPVSATEIPSAPIQEPTTASSSGAVDDEPSQTTVAAAQIQEDGSSSVGISEQTTQRPEEASTEGQQSSSVEPGQDESEPSPQGDDATSSPVQDIQGQTTEQPMRDSSTELPSAAAQDQEFPGTTVPPAGADSIAAQSTPSSFPVQDDSTSPSVDQTTASPASQSGDGSQEQGIDDDKPGSATTEASSAESGSVQDEPQQTTPADPAIAPVSDDSAQPSTESPLEPSTSGSVQADDSHSTPSTDLSTEFPSAAGQPEVTTLPSSPSDSDSTRVSTTQSPSGILEDEPDKTTTAGSVQEAAADSSLPTTQAPEVSSESGTSSDTASDQDSSTDVPSSDSASATSTEQAAILDQSSTPASGEGGEVIGMESVSNAPDGSENLSMTKTSTMAPSEDVISSSTSAPIDSVSSDDNEISSDGSSAEGEQSSLPSTSSEPLPEVIVPSTPSSVEGDELSTSSSAPVDDSSSAADEPESTTPGIVPPVDVESSTVSITSQTESSALTSTTPDLGHPSDNEIIPGESIPDSDKPSDQSDETSEVPQGASTPSIEADGQVTSSPQPPSADSTDDAVSTSAPSIQGISDSETTVAPQQVEGESSSVSPVLPEESSVTTFAPPSDSAVPGEDAASVGPAAALPTTQQPTSEMEESSSASPESDASNDAVSSSSPESIPDSDAGTTSRPEGVVSDDAHEPTTEAVPLPAKPEEGISDIQDQSPAAEQVVTTSSPIEIISGVKDQVADGESVSSTTPQTDASADSGVTTESPEEISSDDKPTEPSAPESGEPSPTTPSAIQQEPQESQTNPPVSSDEGVFSTVGPQVPDITTSAPPSQDDSDAAVGDARPSEEGEDVSGSTTLSPEHDKKEEKVQNSTGFPIAISEDEAAATTPLPESSSPPSTSEPVHSTDTVPIEQDQPADQPPAATTSAPESSISQTTPSPASSETETPEDSDEIRHPDDTTGDDDDVIGLGTTIQPESTSSLPPTSEQEPEGSQQDDAGTTQAPQPSPVVSTEGSATPDITTVSPESETSPSSSTSEPVGGEFATTEAPSITEQPIVSLQPDIVAAMMSSTEKVEMDGGSTTTEVSGSVDDEETTDSSISVPGEGSCFVEGKTYRNGSSIPPTTPCHIACACKNSIVHCLLVHCPPPPRNYIDCKPVYRTGVCCPDYDCGPSEDSAFTVTPETPTGDKEDSVVTVTPESVSVETSDSMSDSAHTPEMSTSTPSSESLVSQQPESSEGPGADSATEIGIQDQPSEDGGSSSEPAPVDISASTAPPPFPVDEPSSATTLIPLEPSSSTDSSSQQPQHDSTEPDAPAPTTTSDRPTDIQQVMESSSNAPSEMATSGSDLTPEEDEQSSSEPPAGSQYPVTTTTTVTPSSAPWPYPTSSTPSPSAMSSGACLFDGRVYMSAQQIPREDPCDFCFCFRGDIICLQQSCPPPIPGCYEEPIPGFCCPRYECPVGNGNHTTPPPLFPPSYYHNQILNNAAAANNGQTGSMTGSVPSGPGCEIQGEYFETGQVITSTSGPCLECRCGATGMMECDPRECQPEPMLRKMIAAITSRRR